MNYHGLVVVAIEKRLSNGWQASGLVHVLARGRPSGVERHDGGRARSSAPWRPAEPTFGSDPNNLTNADGRLPNDRPHVLRHDRRRPTCRGSGFCVSANLQHFSGKPWAATAQVTLPQGDQRILLEAARISPAVVAVRFSISACRRRMRLRRGRTCGVAAGRAQPARRHGRGSAGVGRHRQCHVRTTRARS